jgi:membrane protein
MMQKTLLDLRKFLLFVSQRFARDRCGQIAASLTFVTLLSLVPLISVALTVASAFPVFDGLSNGIKTFLIGNLMPETAGDIIARYMQKFTGSAMRLTTFGLLLLTLSAMWMMLTIDQAFGLIWRARRARPWGRRVAIYSVLLVAGPILIGASVSFNSWLVELSLDHARQLPVLGIFALKLLPLLSTALAFALLFRYVPNRYVPVRHALIAAVVAALLFELMSHGFAYYIRHLASYRAVYGKLSSVPIFLLWIYLSWMVTLFGAVVAASLSHWREPETLHLPPVVRMLDALRVLRWMHHVQSKGDIATFPQMSCQLRIGYETLEEILERLVSAHMVTKAKGRGWLMARSAEEIRGVELLHLFVLDRSSLFVEHGDDPLLRWLADCSAQMEQRTDMSLAELFTAGQA